MLSQHKVSIYCGRNIPSGGEVTDEQVNSFLDQVSVLVECYTVTSAFGVWNGDKEATVVISIIGQDSTKLINDARLIAKAYKGRFAQESVLIEYTSPSVEFI